MFSIQTNVVSLYGQENLQANQKLQQNTIEQLTSGFRINSSADDAAGLAVANGLRNEGAELTQGVSNGNQAVGQLQIIDGGLNNISQILDRLKTLATQAASNTFTGNFTTLNNEFQADLSEINRQAANIGLNNGGNYNTQLSVYVGGGVGNVNGGQIGTAVEKIGLSNQSQTQSVITATSMTIAATFTNASMTYYSSTVMAFTQTSGTYTYYSATATGQAYSFAASFTYTASTLSFAASYTTQTAMAASQTFFAAVDANSLGLANSSFVATGSSATAVGYTSISITDVTSAQAAITFIAAAVANLGKVQGIVGASINQLNFATSLAQSQVTNYSAAQSQIRDADMAQEASNLTKSQTLMQSSMAALAQANQIPQSILKLLQ